MKQKFAIIGCGRIAGRHAEQMIKVGELVAVCDIVYNRAEEFGMKYNAAAYRHIDILLKKEPSVTIVVICTPNGLHAKHTILSLQAGKHVLCEKPLAINGKDAKDMIAAANLAGRKLFVVKQNRYNPPVVAVKDLLTQDKLGNIFSFQINCFWNRPMAYYNDNWRGTKKLDGGILFTQFSHFIDLLYWFLGDVKEVKALAKNFDHATIEIEDSGVVLLEMLSGAIGTINYTINSYQKNMEGSITLFGEKGTVKIGGQYLNELEYQCLDEEISKLPTGKPANLYGFYQGSMSNHDKIYENLVIAIENNNHDFANGEDGLKTVEIIEKIYLKN
ncbi:MAG: Gfo/Idh/MocA family oxidoreductase [Ferruginibacter sp.]